MEEAKKFKFWSIVFLGINSILGAGIFIIPSKAYVALGVNSLYVLLLCAAVATIMALCFAEMAGKFSETGGPYIYVRETFGKFWGFQIGFVRFIIGCTAWGANMIAVPTALSVVHPWFALDEGKAITAIFFILIISYINIRGIRSSEIYNNILTIIKFTPLVIFVVTGIFFINTDNFSNPPNVIPPFSLSALGGGFLLLIYTFCDFENIGVAAQDMENPTKNIPRAIFAVMIILTVVYFFIYVNSIGILGHGMLTSNAPIGDAMATYMGIWARNVIVAVSVVSMLGYSLATAFAGARNIIPLSKDHFMPEKVAENNARGVPGRSIVLVMFITILVVVIAIFASKETFVFLVAVSAIGRFLQYIPVSMALLKSRSLGIKGSFKLAFAGILAPLVIVVSTICLLYSIMGNLKVLYIAVLPLLLLSNIVWFFYSKPKAEKMAKNGVL